MPILTALLDANVLYSAPLRDFLMYVALTNIVRMKWSAQIHQEWMEAVLRTRPDIPRFQLERTRRLMDSYALDAVVENFEHLIDALSLPDPDDRHVLAAAIQSRSQWIVTFNLKDFPAAALSPFGIESVHPDSFVVHLLETAPLSVLSAASEHRQSLKRPPKNVSEYLSTLERQGLLLTVATLREYAALL